MGNVGQAELQNATEGETAEIQVTAEVSADPGEGGVVELGIGVEGSERDDK